MIKIKKGTPPPLAIKPKNSQRLQKQKKWKPTNK